MALFLTIILNKMHLYLIKHRIIISSVSTIIIIIIQFKEISLIQTGEHVRHLYYEFIDF